MQSDLANPSTRDEVEALLDRLKSIPEPRLPLEISTEAIHDLIDRMREESVLLPVHMVEALLCGGLMPIDALPLLKAVQVAPDMVVQTDRLAWDPYALCLVYRTTSVRPDGSACWRRLDRVFRWLSFGDDYADGWRQIDAPPGSTAACDAGWRRVSLELDTVLEAVPLPISPNFPANSHGEPSWTAIDVNGRWQLFDRQLAAAARFECGRDAASAADAALAPVVVTTEGNPNPPPSTRFDGSSTILVDRYVWLDRLNATDPLDE